MNKISPKMGRGTKKEKKTLATKGHNMGGKLSESTE